MNSFGLNVTFSHVHCYLYSVSNLETMITDPFLSMQNRFSTTQFSLYFDNIMCDSFVGF